MQVLDVRSRQPSLYGVRNTERYGYSTLPIVLIDTLPKVFLDLDGKVVCMLSATDPSELHAARADQTLPAGGTARAKLAR